MENNSSVTILQNFTIILKKLMNFSFLSNKPFIIHTELPAVSGRPPVPPTDNFHHLRRHRIPPHPPNGGLRLVVHVQPDQLPAAAEEQHFRGFTPVATGLLPAAADHVSLLICNVDIFLDTFNQSFICLLQIFHSFCLQQTNTEV